MAKQTPSGTGRRDFLRRVAGLAGTAVALAAVRPAQATEVETRPEPAGGYRETGHVRRYYQTARF